MFGQQRHYPGMKMLIALLCVSGAWGQATDPFGAIADGIIKGRRLRLEADRILNERRRIEIENRRLDIEEKNAARAEERMQLEDQRLRLAPPVMDGIDAAIAAVAAKFSDYYAYREEMVRVSVLVTPNAGHTEEYIEAVYLMAKFATFSQSPSRVALGTPAYPLPPAPLPPNVGPAPTALPPAPATLPADFSAWDKPAPKP